MKMFSFGLPIYAMLFMSLCLQAQNTEVVEHLNSLISQPKTEDTTLIKAFNDLGIEFAITKPIKAKTYINKALDLANKIGAPRGAAGSYNCLGIVNYYQKEYDDALINFRKAKEINNRLGHKWGEASALHQVGVIQNLLSKHKEAIESFKEAGIIFISLNDSISHIKTIENTGVSYNLMKRQKEALEYFIKSNKLFEKLNNTQGLGRTYIHISSLLMKQKEYQKALEYLDEALVILEHHSNITYKGIILNSIGICYRELDNYVEALNYFQKSLLQKKIGGKQKRIASTQANIGETYYDMKLYTNALTYLHKALNNYSLKGEFNKKIRTHNSIAKSYLKLAHLDSANYHAEKALSIAKEIDDIEGKKEINHTLALIAEQEGDTDKAYMRYKKLSELKDALAIIQKQEQARELHTKYETEKKQVQISQLEKQKEESEQKNIVLIIIMFASILVLGVCVYFFRKKFKLSCLEKMLISKELRDKKKQLTTNSLHLAKKNEILENLKEEVQFIKYSEDQNKQYNYQKILHTINNGIKEDQDWNNFKKYFEEVENDFYSNIKNKYPEVTGNELRLMALMKMNLSSKEIGRILNITQEGVRKARYRLRKKLKIDSNNKLIDIIISS